MSIVEESRKSIRGALRFARLDVDGIEDFNVSLDGFWRSFTAAVLCLPGYLYLVASDGDLAKIDPAKMWVVQTIAYTLAWTAWPLMSFYMTRAFDRGDRHLAYIIVYNWAQVIGYYAIVLVIVLFGEGDMGRWVFTIVYFVVLAYEWFIAWKLLDIPVGGAVGVQFLNVLLGLAIFSAKDMLLQVP